MSRLRALALSWLLATPVAAQTVTLGALRGTALPVPGAAQAVVIIPGSGPTDRDGNSTLGLATDSYRLLAEGLAAAGIASIRIDKRGMFGSAGAVADANAVTLADYAADARAWVARARDLAPCVWLAGHSEGGLVALVAAQDPPPGLCGLILLAAPGLPLGRTLLDQIAANPLNAPLLPAATLAVGELQAGRRVDPATLPAPLRPLFPQAVQGFLIDLFAADPAALAAGWDGPALVVQPLADVQIGPAHGAALAAALPRGERLDLPGATHVLKAEVPGAPMATYTDPGLPLHPDLVPGIAGFLARHPPP